MRCSIISSVSRSSILILFWRAKLGTDDTRNIFCIKYYSNNICSNVNIQSVFCGVLCTCSMLKKLFTVIAFRLFESG